jgi:hypothetical protein
MIFLPPRPIFHMSHFRRIPVTVMRMSAVKGTRRSILSALQSATQNVFIVSAQLLISAHVIEAI